MTENNHVAVTSLSLVSNLEFQQSNSTSYQKTWRCFFYMQCTLSTCHVCICIRSKCFSQISKHECRRNINTEIFSHRSFNSLYFMQACIFDWLNFATMKKEGEVTCISSVYDVCLWSFMLKCNWKEHILLLS